MAAPNETAEKHQPYVPDEAVMPEFTWSAVVVGSFLGIVFAGSSLYLVLKVGMTVSASIPVSVLAITVFRAFSKTFGFRRTTILENNIVQTSGSAGESVAFGVGVTMPALLILGFNMDITRVMVVSILGGILGILAMIPLRRAFIVRLHGKPGEPGKLLYPEGTACAQVLISGEKGGTTGKTVFIGFGVAFLHKFLTEGMNVLVETVKLPLTVINKSAVFAGAMASEMLGVGYIIGLRTSAVMMSGAILGYLVIIPLIAFVGADGMEKPVPPGEKLISEMSTRELRDNYLLFIGAGCVATAGIISMGRTMPMIVRSIRAGLGGMEAAADNGTGSDSIRRTENDMSLRVVLFGSLGLIGLLALFLLPEVGPWGAVAGALLVVLFGFLFVTVSSRLTGEIGSSSNPISGMTVATLTLTCLIFLALGWSKSTDRVLALSIAAVVCVAASNGGTTAQSLKTGFLVGGTPKLMQYAILIGSLTSALVIGVTLLAFNAAGTVYSQKPENLPNITLNQEEIARLKNIGDWESYGGERYLIWDTRCDTFEAGRGYSPRPELASVKRGRYLLDENTGRPRYLKDPTIMGRLEETDDGVKVKRDFDAPKTQVMGLIIDGVLQRKLNWSLVLIGGLIAVMLELCSVSSLAFAVGVYVPIQYSTPIFLGGLLRWGIDRYLAGKQASEIADAGDPEARARAEIEAIRKSETSPGVLLAAGYIAGGSLAGMMIAFFNFSDELPDLLSSWQYRKIEILEARPSAGVFNEIAFRELGIGQGKLDSDKKAKADMDKFIEDLEELNAAELEKWAAVPKGTLVRLPKKATYKTEEDTYLGRVSKGKGTSVKVLMKLNREELIPEVPVPKGANMRLPDYSLFTVKEDTTLGKMALEIEQGKYEAESLWKMNKDYQENKDKLKLPEKSAQGIARLEPAQILPAGAIIKVPQSDWPALAAFAALAVFLVAVGTGMLLKGQPEGNGPEA